MRYSYKLLFAIMVMLFTGLSLMAQQVKVNGTLTDAETKEPLIGATIRETGTNNGTVTDLDGNYNLDVSPDAELTFSYVGYKEAVQSVNNRSVINVAMALDIEALAEVVVLGYGGVRKSDLTGSVATVDSKKLKAMVASNPIDALQGQVPGLQITNNSGAPGASPTVSIRGVGTPGNPSPLYVVDGVLLNDMSFVNGADIASITVLKDASALAIYGNRGANGVIIVKTKQGTMGQEPRISISSSYGVQVQQNRIDLLDKRDYANVINAITPGTYNNIDALPNTDWQELIFETAPIQTHTASISGASKNNQYYFSVGYFGQDGTIPESSYERLTVKINELYKPKEFLSLGANVTIAPFWQDNTRGDAPFNVYRASPMIAPRDANGNFNEVPGVGNILADLEYTTNNKTSGVRTVGQLFLEATFLKGFTAKTNLGIEALTENNEVFTPVFFVSPTQQNEETRYGKNRFSRTSLLWENTLNWDKEIERHRINAVAGFTVQETTNEQLNLVGRNLFRDQEEFRYIDPSNIDPTGVSNGVRDAGDFYIQLSYLTRVNYSFDNRYLATFTFRRDGSSKFLEDNKYGNFPAVALGWNIFNEKFITIPQVITNLKLRGSWGIVGNDKINYLSAYSTVDNNINGVFGSNEQQYFGQTDGGLGNPDLQWEEIEQFNIGLELGVYQQKLTAELDYYQRTTTGTLIGLQLPDYIGNGTNLVTFNAGSFLNRGLEVNLNWEDEIGDVFYTIGVQGTTIHNETLQVSGVESAEEIFGNAQGSIVSRTAKGLPIGAYYGYIVDGVFQTEEEVDAKPSLSGTEPGDLIFRDVNEDGVLNGDDRTFIGSPIPDLNYGINLSATYKGVSLTMLFQGQYGNELYNIKETVRPAQYNYEQHVADFWRGSGTSNSEPRPTTGGNNYEPSTRFIQDGSFFRLRSLTISYALPKTLLESLKVNQASIYARGNNIFTLTEYTGYSPEIGGGPLTTGIDQGTYPVASIYTFGIDLTF
ncbi:MAG: TonB-dependent receptor [Cyclobacteriaceae bacterium]